jgi:hypothetical protein
MRWPMIVLVALSGTVWAAGRIAWGSPEARQRMKPLAPVQIELTALPRDKKDSEGQQRLRVSVVPRIDAPRLEVSLTLPPGVRLVHGETRWQAPAHARVAQARDLVLDVPKTGAQRVVAVARILLPKSLPLSRAASYTFNAPAEPARPETGTAPPPPLKEPSTVPTIPVKPAPRGR